MADLALLTGLWLDQELHTDDSTILFTSTRRSQAINDGVAEFADLTECIRRVSSVAVSCNTATYDCLDSTVFGSTDFSRFSGRGVEYHFTDSNGTLTQVSGTEFPRRDIEWLNRNDPGWRQSTSPTEIPDGYYVDEDDGQQLIGLHPPPDVGSSETATIVVPYVARPPALSNSTDVPFTINGRTRTDLIPFHRGIVHYAAHLLEKLRGDDQASDRQYAQFLGYVQKYRAATRKKGPEYVTFAKSYLRDAQRRIPNYGRLSGNDPYRYP